jgi:hypothetical protein
MAKRRILELSGVITGPVEVDEKLAERVNPGVGVCWSWGSTLDCDREKLSLERRDRIWLPPLPPVLDEAMSALARLLSP